MSNLWNWGNDEITRLSCKILTISFISCFCIISLLNSVANDQISNSRSSEKSFLYFCMIFIVADLILLLEQVAKGWGYRKLNSCITDWWPLKRVFNSCKAIYVKCSEKYVYFKQMGVVFKSCIILICIPCANFIRRWKAGGFYNWISTFPNLLQFIFCTIQQSTGSW